MIGLLIKDFMAIKQQGKILIFLLVFYLIFALVTNSSSIMGTMFVIVCLTLPITAISYDERASWDKYALSTPISRKTIVLSKYLFGLIIALLGMIILIALTALTAYLSPEIYFSSAKMAALLSLSSVALLGLAIILPILFRFGVEKGRFIMMIVFLIPMIAMTLWGKLGAPHPSQDIIRILPYVAIIISILGLLVSYAISLRIYHHKEF